MPLFRIFSWEDSLGQQLLARDTAGVRVGILSLEAPRQAVGTGRQTELLFISSSRLPQLQTYLNCIWIIPDKEEVLATREAGFELCDRSWCASAQTLTCGLLVV